MSVPILEVNALSKAYGGVRALSGVSFTLEPGELLAMIGPNGAGKTTCFNMVNGQTRPDSGAIVFDGRNLVGLKPRQIWRAGVGRTFQVTATFGSMTVRENVQMALLAHRRALRSLFTLAGKQHVEDADALLEQVGMRGQAGRACSVLAYGDLKRVELAVALANKPRLLLMDEPTAGMAPRERGELMRLVAGLAHRANVAVLFTEHDMDVVFGHADRIIVLNRGELIAQGRPQDVRGDARVREVYLGSRFARA